VSGIVTHFKNQKIRKEKSEFRSSKSFNACYKINSESVEEQCDLYVSGGNQYASDSLRVSRYDGCCREEMTCSCFTDILHLS